MKNSHFHFFLFILTVGFGLLGYYSYKTIDYSFTDSIPSVNSDGISQLDPTVVPLDQIAPVAVVDDSTVKEDTEPKEPTTTKELTGQYKTISEELQKLIKDDIRMKIGSSGTRVGTVQKFLNIYLDKNETVDNKYGAGTKRNIEAFQKESGDELDGLADPGTYQKMIDWLIQNKAQ